MACRALSALQQLLHLASRAEGAQDALQHFVQSAASALKALTAHSLSGALWGIPWCGVARDAGLCS